MSRYLGRSKSVHKTQAKTAILLTNLGTPEAPTAKALRTYLKEFLSDPRVVEIPRLVWLIILHGIILRIRPKKSAKLYQSIWTDAGSPLMVISEQIKAKVDNGSLMQRVVVSREMPLNGTLSTCQIETIKL